MNRPRPSVLELFDPLTGEDLPEFDEGASFLTTGILPRSTLNDLNPVRLTRRLVEVGDVTMDLDGASYSLGVEEREDEGVGRDGADGEWESEPNISQPLAHAPSVDSILDDVERTPMCTRTYRGEQDTPSGRQPSPLPTNKYPAPLLGSSGIPSSPTPPPPTLVVSSLDDGISEQGNDSGSSEEDTTPHASLISIPLVTPTGSLIADTGVVLPTPLELSPRPHALPPQAHTPNSGNLSTSAVDMHASFALNLRMGLDDSFDLLNDKISFLDQGIEESFELDGMMPLHNGDIPVEVPTAGLVDTSLVHGDVDVAEDVLVEVPPPVVTTAPSPHPSTPPAPVFVAPAPQKATPPQASMNTLAAPPALIPALKIIKRKRPEPAVAAVRKSSAEAVAAPVRTVSTRTPSPVPPTTAGPSTGQIIAEGPGPRRVPVQSNDRGRATTVVPNPAIAAGNRNITGPKRVALPVVDEPAPTKTLSAAPVLKRPLRQVPPNAPTVSSLPRPTGTSGIPTMSRLPMPKSRIMAPGKNTTTSSIRRKVT